MALLSAFSSALVFCGWSLLSPPAPDGFSSLLGTSLSPLLPLGCEPAFCCCGTCSCCFCLCLSCFLPLFCCLPPLPCCWPFATFGWPWAWILQFTNSNCIYWDISWKACKLDSSYRFDEQSNFLQSFSGVKTFLIILFVGLDISNTCKLIFLLRLYERKRTIFNCIQDNLGAWNLKDGFETTTIMRFYREFIDLF